MGLEALAFVLEYPGVEFASKVEAARLEPGGTERMDRALRALAHYLQSEGKDEAEERYTQLFDLSPV